MALNWKAGTGRYFRPEGSLVYAVLGEDGNPFLVFWPDAQVGSAATRRDVVRRDDKLVIVARPGPGESQLPEIVLEDGMQGHWESSGAQVYTDRPAWLLLARPIAPQRAAVRVVTSVVTPGGVASAAPSMVVGAAMMPPVKTPHVDDEPQDDDEELHVQTDELKDAVEVIFRNYRVGRGPAGVILLASDEGVFTLEELGEQLGDDVVCKRKWDVLKALRYDGRTVQLKEQLITALPQRGFLVSQGDDKPWLWHDPDSRDNVLFARRRESFLLNLQSAANHAWRMAVNNSNLPLLAVVGMLSGGDHVRPYGRHGDRDLDLLVHCPRRAMRNITAVMLTGDAGVVTPRGLAVLSYRPRFGADGSVTYDIEKRAQHEPPYAATFDSKGRPRVFARF